MDQARSEEEEKERKRDRKDRGQEADGKKGSPTKQNTSEELKQAYYLVTGRGEQRIEGGGVTPTRKMGITLGSLMHHNQASLRSSVKIYTSG